MSVASDIDDLVRAAKKLEGMLTGGAATVAQKLWQDLERVERKVRDLEDHERRNR